MGGITFLRMRALRGHRSANVKREGSRRSEAAWAATAVVAGSLAVASWVGVGAVAADEAGTTATVCGSVSMRLTDWAATVALPKFDPALGTLQKVTITGTLKVEGSGKAENTGPSPATIVANVSASGTLSVPGALPQTVSASAPPQSFAASAYDQPSGQAPDFVGTSAFSTGTLNTFGAFPTVELTGDKVASYVGTGSWDSSAAANGLSNATGAGNLVAVFTTSAQADVCVAYSYLIPPTTTTTTLAPTTTTAAPTTTVVQQLVPTTADTPGGLLPATGRSSGTVAWPAAFLTVAGVAVLRLARRRPAAR